MSEHNQDVTTLRAIQEWLSEAAEQVDDIGAWREVNPVNRASYWQHESAKLTGTPPTATDFLFRNTAIIVDRLTHRHPSLETKPFLDIYNAIKAWHDDRNASRVPPQAELLSTLDHAALILNGVMRGLERQLCYPSKRATRGAAGPDKTAAALRNLIDSFETRFEAYTCTLNQLRLNGTPDLDEDLTNDLEGKINHWVQVMQHREDADIFRAMNLWELLESLRVHRSDVVRVSTPSGEKLTDSTAHRLLDASIGRMTDAWFKCRAAAGHFLPSVASDIAPPGQNIIHSFSLLALPRLPEPEHLRAELRWERAAVLKHLCKLAGEGESAAVNGAHNGTEPVAITTNSDVLTREAPTQAPKPPKGRYKWEEVAERAEKYVKSSGDKWPGLRALAGKIGCSTHTLRRATDHSRYLTAREAEYKHALQAKRTPAELISEEIAQQTHDDPAKAAGAVDELQRLIGEQAADVARDDRQTTRRQKTQRRPQV